MRKYKLCSHETQSVFHKDIPLFSVKVSKINFTENYSSEDVIHETSCATAILFYPLVIKCSYTTEI